MLGPGSMIKSGSRSRSSPLILGVAGLGEDGVELILEYVSDELLEPDEAGDQGYWNCNVDRLGSSSANRPESMAKAD